MPEFNLLYTGLLIAGVIAFTQGFVAYLILAERKVAAWVQDRLGPNRVGPFGLLQPIADGGKLFLKEEVIPSHVDKIFFVLAPIVAFSTALLALAVVPVGTTVAPPGPQETLAAFNETQAEYASHFSMVIVPGLDIGILYSFAIGSLAVYGVILAGWSANNKYSLLGSLRSSAQIISYEIPLGMSVVGVLLFAGSMNLETIIAWQAKHGWNLFYQPLAFLLFMTSVYAECNRLPFDLPEAEQELVGGYHTEYSSSMKLGLMLMAEYIHMITTSFLMSILFWGGWSLFGVEDLVTDPIGSAVLKTAILGGKMTAFVGLYLLVRWTIPRFRFDQLMTLAWKVMMPLALLHLVAALIVRQFNLPLVSLTGMSLALFVGAGFIAARSGGPNNLPRRPAKHAVRETVGV
ncbi:NADH-quinone oxidoreductase subunit NuoH [Fimbriiglobus ruber]|uniref:NADH-quinone oxidoreductase subunit H n=1 Tax=Fimbriiglobus ruber TaxID=1908690 RepID=A0A225DJM0_9BACT|nr:NADH-quinone oxidoreductase subunit NuoH [Fimbriiglobus ruber]OWK41660.1 NADH-ubiquinone oxidoreductase chain H [Fimbriiglobus ruber]